MTGTRPENWSQALASLAQGRPALIWRKTIADTETPVGAAVKLIEPGRGDFLLESVEGGEVRGRYSLLGLDPDLVFRATGGTCEINRNWRSDRAAFVPLAGGSLAELRALVESCRIGRARRPAPGAGLPGRLFRLRDHRPGGKAAARPAPARSNCPTCCSSVRR